MAHIYNDNPVCSQWSEYIQVACLNRVCRFLAEYNLLLYYIENIKLYIGRSKNNEARRTSNGSQSLLSNVSFDEGPEDEDSATPLNHSVQSVNSDRDPHRKHNSGYLSNRTAVNNRSKPEMSNSYQKLLDRSNDLESPLKLFAQKHGFQLAQSDSAVPSSGEKSPSPADMTVTDLTKETSSG